MVGRLTIGIVLSVAVWHFGTHPETRVFAKIDSPPPVLEQKTAIDTREPKKLAIEPLKAKKAKPTVVEKKLVHSKVLIKPQISTPKNTNPVVSTTPTDNESIVWNKLIAAGYTRNQTAGIMGNLYQEHRFNTSDVAGGLGIAQWMGGRRANLMAKGNYLDINVQADFLIEELRGPENHAHKAIIANNSLENAVYAFQNKFERCNPVYCMPGQRIAYAHSILARH